MILFNRLPVRAAFFGACATLESWKHRRNVVLPGLWCGMRSCVWKSVGIMVTVLVTVLVTAVWYTGLETNIGE
jgi:hypothetical protein